MMYLPLLAACVGGAAAAGERVKRKGGPEPTDFLDDKLARYALMALGLAVAVVFIFRSSTRFRAHIRRLMSLNNDSQRYFIRPSQWWAKLKKHGIYAPVFRNRHNREFRLSSAINMGTLPTRFQAILLIGILAMNVTLCTTSIAYPLPQSDVLGVIRNRTGTICVVNMIPLFVMAGRNNPLIRMLNVSFDTWNLLHRWLGRIVVLEALAHVLCWMIDDVREDGWAAVQAAITHSSFIMSGFVAMVCFFFLMVHSPSALRHAFYETFLHLHIAVVMVSLGFLWVHLNDYHQQNYLLSAIVIWAFERFIRLALLAYHNVGNGGTSATVEALPGDAMRITLKMARPWKFRPGQHLYLYLPSVGLWTSHPFTVAWSEAEEQMTDEKGLVMSRQDVLALQKTTMSLVVRRRTGVTDKLFERVNKSVGGRISLGALAEGPYGAHHSLKSYGTVMMFAGGVGITHHVAFVRQLVAGYTEGMVAARRITLVWIIQSPEHLEWIRPWMTTILGMEKRRDILKIMLFITRPRNTKEIHSPSSTVQMFPGRPNIDTLIEMEAENQVGAMGVMVCGTGSLSDDVRRVCRKRQTDSHIDFVEESFSW
ncbi:hypothetical protein FQN54_004729 [Arachnomyces sp. PD_36]|nr:hypothetical protein FQN54_004729 [Arachnomyces sp. PD_36]